MEKGKRKYRPAESYECANAVGVRITGFRTIKTRGFWAGEFEKGEWPNLWVLELENGSRLVGPCDPNNLKRTCESAFIDEDKVKSPWVAWVQCTTPTDELFCVAVHDVNGGKTHSHITDCVYYVLND